MKFKAADPKVNFPEMEKKILQNWYQKGIVEKYLKKNQGSSKKFSFLDGPITANNPMGVHHAWGRTYKDLWQRFFNMRGFKQRFQNGFDEQGLWVEVEVEKELGLKSKKEIENLISGNKFASLEKFVNLCKERVNKYSNVQTEQSKRLGYFMDWDNSYHTSSDENNYAIWNFLKVVNQKGWLYKGRDSVPWCPRCGTAISQHEILTEEYKELTHDSVYIEYPVEGKDHEYLLVWTTTPWTLPGNVAVAIDPDKDYVKARGDVKSNTYYLGKVAAEKLKLTIEKTFKGKELVGLKYRSPFDDLPRIKKSMKDRFHEVIETDSLILPVSEEEGTGLIHMAPGAGSEDFQLGKKINLPVIELIDEEAKYLNDLGEFTGKNAKTDPKIILNYLTNLNNGEYLFEIVPYKHMYPTCWRCKTELVWRVVDEWYIAMNKMQSSKFKVQSSKLNKKETFREQMIDAANKINWLPKWGLDRELDWLKNMHDWLISKKRYWGLALPIWECAKCGSFEVIGGIEELEKKATEGWEEFKGHSPHRPWIDQVKIKCSQCQEVISRIPDVGNPWLDAGIVPFSTMPTDWFPADFITESFPGQFKNWFYSLIAMSTALKETNPFKTVLGFASVRDEKGEEMHKSKGNAIEFNEAADQIGVDVMRWLYSRANPENNLNFGYQITDEVRRFFHLRLWNVYSFLTMYAAVDNWQPQNTEFRPKNTLDRWILSKVQRSIENIDKSLEKYDAFSASGVAESFVVEDLSNWYVRRIRDRVGPTVPDCDDKNDAYQTLWQVLTTYSKILAPFVPFITEEIYTNLTSKPSVHLVSWPESDKSLIDIDLEEEMSLGVKLASVIHAFRKDKGIKVRVPLISLSYAGPKELSKEVLAVVLGEVNVKSLKYIGSAKEYKVEGETDASNQDLDMGAARDLVRLIQEKRKEAGVNLSDYIVTYAPKWPQGYDEYIKHQTFSKQLIEAPEIKIVKA